MDSNGSVKMSSKSFDCVTSLQEELSKVEKRYEDFEGKFNMEYDRFLTELIRLRDIFTSQTYNDLSNDERLLIQRNLYDVKERMANLIKQHREIHPVISKFGRTLDKTFLCEPEIMSHMLTTAKPLDDEHTANELLNMSICEKLLRQGYHDVLDRFVKESNTPCDHLKPLMEIGRIVEALHRHDLDPAISWVDENRSHLTEERSLLEFQLERLRFIEILRQRGPELHTQLLKQARRLTALKQYDHEELCHVMGSLLFLDRGIDDSPYAAMLDENQWDITAQEFARQACRLAGLNQDCPLDVAFDKGYDSMPRLLNMNRQVEKLNMGAIYEEMAMSMEVADAHEYHNVFCCPILRSHCTITNPPMRLDCGHAVSKDAVLKLGQAGRLKCPYCPREMDPKSPQELIF